MGRDEFIGYLASRAEALDIPLHASGELAGLPREFHHALAIAQMLDALGRRAPSGALLRAWYGEAAFADGETARWVYRSVGLLRNPDLERLDPSELTAFWVRFDTWGAAAHVLVRSRRRKIHATQQ